MLVAVLAGCAGSRRAATPASGLLAPALSVAPPRRRSWLAGIAGETPAHGQPLHGPYGPDRRPCLPDSSQAPETARHIVTVGREANRTRTSSRGGPRRRSRRRGEYPHFPPDPAAEYPAVCIRFHGAARRASLSSSPGDTTCSPLPPSPRCCPPCSQADWPHPEAAQGRGPGWYRPRHEPAGPSALTSRQRQRGNGGPTGILRHGGM
jgi:hypothetical protein